MLYVHILVFLINVRFTKQPHIKLPECMHISDYILLFFTNSKSFRRFIVTTFVLVFIGLSKPWWVFIQGNRSITSVRKICFEKTKAERDEWLRTD